MARTLSKHPAIYRAVTRLAEKAEKLDAGVVTAAFVDVGHLTRLRGPNSQYIEGRRGTGKTHLLMYLAGDINLKLPTDRTAAVYLDLRELRTESAAAELDGRATAKRVFRDIANGLLQGLRDLDARVLWHNSVPTERSAYEKQAAQRSREALLRLERAIRGVPIPLTPPQASERRARNSVVSDAAGFGFQLDSTLKHLVGGQASLEGRTEKRVETSTAESTEYEYRISFSHIRGAVEEFLEVNDLTCLYVCLDEWSSISVKAQPLLAEYIKRAFLSTPRIALKIAVLPFLARLSASIDGSTVGLERGGDIFEGIDLDSELVFARHPVRAATLLRELLFSHLKFLVESDSSSEQFEFYDSPDSALADLVSDAALRRLLVFSQGNPRDFLTLFKYAYLSFFDGHASEVGAPQVEAGAKAFGIEKLENVRENLEAQNLFNAIVAEVLQKQKQSAFLVHTKHQTDTLLQHLLHSRVLHVWDESYSSPNVSGERFMVLSIDYCIIVEHLKSPKYRGLLELPFTEEAAARLQEERDRLDLAAKLLSTEKPDKRSVRYVLLPDSCFTRRQHARCPACEVGYALDHPVAVRARVCPHCAEPLPQSEQAVA